MTLKQIFLCRQNLIFFFYSAEYLELSADAVQIFVWLILVY